MSGRRRLDDGRYNGMEYELYCVMSSTLLPNVFSTRSHSSSLSNAEYHLILAQEFHQYLTCTAQVRLPRPHRDGMMFVVGSSLYKLELILEAGLLGA